MLAHREQAPQQSVFPDKQCPGFQTCCKARSLSHSLAARTESMSVCRGLRITPHGSVGQKYCAQETLCTSLWRTEPCTELPKDQERHTVPASGARDVTEHLAEHIHTLAWRPDSRFPSQAESPLIPSKLQVAIHTLPSPGWVPLASQGGAGCMQK